MFVVFVSLGEAIWSPRWYDYSMSVAPEVRACPPALLSHALGCFRRILLFALLQHCPSDRIYGAVSMQSASSAVLRFDSGTGC